MKIQYNPPPWVTKVIRKESGTIAKAFGKKYLPRDIDVNELGTGHYGTVFSTAEKNIVLKITSDPTEAEFINWLGTLPKDKRDWDDELAGLVKYYGIVELNVTHRRRPVNAILREGAYKVGYYDVIPQMKKTAYNPEYVEYQSSELRHHLQVFQRMAALVRKYEKRLTSEQLQNVYHQSDEEYYAEIAYTGWEKRGPIKKKALIALTFMRNSIELMQNTWITKIIGNVYAHLMEYGVILADVHLNNIGLVKRQNTPVITDPGHMIKILKS